jgi:hypothetical protein
MQSAIHSKLLTEFKLFSTCRVSIWLSINRNRWPVLHPVQWSVPSSFPQCVSTWGFMSDFLLLFSLMLGPGRRTKLWDGSYGKWFAYICFCIPWLDLDAFRTVCLLVRVRAFVLQVSVHAWLPVWLLACRFADQFCLLLLGWWLMLLLTCCCCCYTYIIR